MSLLATAFREAVNKDKSKTYHSSEMDYSVSYQTGLLPFDFANGYIQDVNGKLKFELGISDGSINEIIGASGVGKTTLIINAACNIIKPFKTSCIFFEQAEVGTNIQRIKNLSGYQSDIDFTNRIIVRDAGITIESIYERIRMIHDIKCDNPDKYLYSTGMINMRGEPVMKFEPTVVLIDSIKMIYSKKNTEADETNNMTGATNAKSNAEYYGKMVPLCREANIIIIAINHITTDIQTGMMPKKPEFPWLKQGEHLPGSKLLHYISNTITRLDIKSKLKSDEGFGIDGTLVQVDMVKSRTNKSGRSRCILVFDQETGFDNDISLFLILKEMKLIEGAGAFLRLPGCDVKFSQKGFKQAISDNPELYNAFVNLCYKVLTDTLIAEYKRIQEEQKRKVNTKSPYETIMSMINSYDFDQMAA